jgi:toxin ParE1/3/4
MSRVIQRPEAKLGIIEIADHIAQNNLETAQRFIQAVEESYTFLATFPESGELWNTSNPKYLKTRFWPVRGFPNHLIFFRPLRDCIEVLAVIHAARDIQSLFG